jgi:hypothetical protein
MKTELMTAKGITTVLLVLMLAMVRPGYGQEMSDQELAKATQNPLAAMISLPFPHHFRKTTFCDWTAAPAASSRTK